MRKRVDAHEGDDDEADMEMDEEDGDAGRGANETATDEMDEEAMMNASADVQAAVAKQKAEEWEEVQEPVEAKHRPRDPVISALQNLSTVCPNPRL